MQSTPSTDKMYRDPKEIKFFVGTEVENTVAQGLKTLFVVGAQGAQHIWEQAQAHQVEHVYLGANQSFVIEDAHAYMQLVQWLTAHDIWVTLDLPLYCALLLIPLYNSSVFSHPKFIPMLSVKAQGIEDLADNPRATLKIDDDVTSVVNSGVWCMPLSTLLGPQFKTEWAAYKEDRDV